MLIFIGAGHVKPGKIDQVLDALRLFMPKVRTEPGTLEYAVYRGVDDPNMVVFLEKYQDQDAQAVHGSSEEFKAFQQVIMSCIEGQPIMGVVEEVASTHQ